MAEERESVGFKDSKGDEIYDGDFIGKDGEPYYRLFLDRGSRQPMMDNLHMHHWTEGIFMAPNPISPICNRAEYPHLPYWRLHELIQEWINDCKFVIIKSS